MKSTQHESGKNSSSTHKLPSHLTAWESKYAAVRLNGTWNARREHRQTLCVTLQKKVAWCLLSHIRVCTLGRRLGREWCCWHVSHSNTEDCLITGLGCHLSLCCRLITRSRRSLICVCVWWYEVDIPTVRATVYATALARLLAKMFGRRRIVEAMCFPLG